MEAILMAKNRLSDKKTIRHQGNIVREYRRRMDRIIAEIEHDEEFRKEKGFKELRVHKIILEECESAIFYHDNYASKIKDLVEGMPKDQSRLVPEGAKG